MIIEQQQIDALQTRLEHQFSDPLCLVFSFTQYFNSVYYLKKGRLFRDYPPLRGQALLTIQTYQETLREYRRHLSNSIRLILLEKKYPEVYAEQILSCLMDELNFLWKIADRCCLTREKDAELAKAQALFIIHAVRTDFENQGNNAGFLTWLTTKVELYIEEAVSNVSVEGISKKMLAEEINALREMLTEQEVMYAEISDEQTRITTENFRLQQALEYTNQELERTRQALQHAIHETFHYQTLLNAQTTTIIKEVPLSSKIDIFGLKKINFIDRVLALPSKGLGTSVSLPPLRAAIPQHEDSGEYFKQFPDYIFEEIRASIDARLKIITDKRLHPFPARLNLKEENVSPTDKMIYWSCTTNLSNLPKLDHGFYREAVLIKTIQAYDPKTTFAKDKLNGILAIASLHNHLDNSDNKEKNVLIKLIFSKTDYEEQADEWYEQKGEIQLHWLTGLIPSERMYEVCLRMPTVCFQEQFIRGALLNWPEIEMDVPDRPDMVALASLNDVQKNIVMRLQQLESGLYFLQGPPGTGKTTTAVSLLMQLTALHPGKRILVCAPSNQAVRVILANTRVSLPNIAMALTGIAKNIPESLKDVFVHYYAQMLSHTLIELKKNFRQKITAKSARSFVTQTENHYGYIITQINNLLTVETQMHVKEEIRASLRHFLDKLLEHKNEFLMLSQVYLESHEKTGLLEVQNEKRNALVDHMETSIKYIQSVSHSIESFLIQRAQFVFATLVSAGRNWLRKQISQFDIVILDEAAQALVPEALIPLLFNPKLYIQIGDPNQLPATVISKAAQEGNFSNSMMHWLTKELDQPYERLSIQYRMHPSICNWPSNQYYEGSLATAPTVIMRDTILTTPALHDNFRRPCLFFNIENAKENRRGGPEASASISNENEAECIVRMVYYLINTCGLQANQIGIITFYTAQLELLKQKLNNNKILPEAKRRDLVVSTVDGFQGEERDITLISVVRTSKSVGFLNDPRRLNVAMTRAKHARWIFGFFAPLQQSNSDLPDLLIEHQVQNNVIKEADFRKIVK